MNRFILTLDETRRPDHCPDADAAALVLSVEHPQWQLVKKLERTWELSTDDSLETVREMLPDHLNARPMVGADAKPPSLTVHALRDAIARSRRGSGEV